MSGACWSGGRSPPNLPTKPEQDGLPGPRQLTWPSTSNLCLSLRTFACHFEPLPVTSNLVEHLEHLVGRWDPAWPGKWPTERLEMFFAGPMVGSAFPHRRLLMNLLTLETTCDETSAAIVSDRLEVLGAVVASQEHLHQRFGGVVPELASRAHVERILPVVQQTLQKASLTIGDVNAVAVATTPGLAGSLLVGLAAAKALAVALRIPLITVDHLQAHIYACRMAYGPEVFPCVGLIVSGGHTNLYLCRTPLEFEPLGSTIDDAAGEAFDKVAALLGLPYPGGPAVERAAQGGDPQAYRFPRSFLHEPQRLAWSFSGLKTALRYQLVPPGTSPTKQPGAPKASPPVKPTGKHLADLAASFQEAVVDVLVAKSLAAVTQNKVSALCVGGGVAANARLREALTQAAQAANVKLYIAPPWLCTDNAVMGAIAWERLAAGQTDSLEANVTPGLQRLDPPAKREGI